MASTVLAAAWGRTLPEWSLVLVARALLAAVHYVEVVAHRLGERYGTLVLAVAVTISEVALLISMMLSGGESTSALARDTVFAAVMIVCNGVVGLCLLVGGLRHREIEFRVEGTSPALAVLAALATLTMVLPGDHDHHRGPDTLDLPTGVRRARTDWRACVNGTTSLAERPMTDPFKKLQNSVQPTRFHDQQEAGRGWPGRGPAMPGPEDTGASQRGRFETMVLRYPFS